MKMKKKKREKMETWKMKKRKIWKMKEKMGTYEKRKKQKGTADFGVNLYNIFLLWTVEK